MSIRAKGDSGKLSGVADIIRKETKKTSPSDNLEKTVDRSKDQKNKTF